MLVEAPGELPVPPTIHALVAARLERLPEEERALLARVSVEGTVFHREAVRELAPASLVPVVDRSLTALVRKDVIRPDRSSFAEDDAFRFRHMLIRGGPRPSGINHKAHHRKDQHKQHGRRSNFPTASSNEQSQSVWRRCLPRRYRTTSKIVFDVF